MKVDQTEKKKVNKLDLVLSVIAILAIAAIGTFLLHMQNADDSAIMQPERVISDETTDETTGETTDETGDNEANKTEPDKAPASQMININTAPKEELMLLKGIGEKKAESIIAYREQTPFQKPEDITNVSGIGEKTYEAIADSICVN